MAKGIIDKRAKWDKIMAAAKVIPQASAVYVGVTGPDAEKMHPESHITNAQLAAAHEFGVHEYADNGERGESSLPERPFIRPATDKNTSKYMRLGEKLGDKVIMGEATVDQLLGTIGAVAAADVQNYIASNSVRPPSTPETNKRKGSTTTLVDHGILKASITWRTGVDEPPAKEQAPGELSVFDLYDQFQGGGS